MICKKLNFMMPNHLQILKRFIRLSIYQMVVGSAVVRALFSGRGSVTISGGFNT